MAFLFNDILFKVVPSRRGRTTNKTSASLTIDFFLVQLSWEISILPGTRMDTFLNSGTRLHENNDLLTTTKNYVKPLNERSDMDMEQGK